VDGSFLRDSHVRETFLEILDQRGNVAPILRMMHEVGLLGKFLPEFGRLTCLVQHEFYHQYTTDEHTLVCLEKLDQVFHAKAPPFNAYTDIFQKVERPFVLYLALLLHDAGKAEDGKKTHEQIGAELAIKVSKRLGLDGATAHTLQLLIEHHLDMASVSQRRDLDDPSVIKNFAGIVQTVETLDMLTLHTFADSMGTSDQLWNSFKDMLLRTLYVKTREALAGGTAFLKAEEKQRELLADEVRRIMPRSFSDEELHGHFDNLPPRYFQINSAKEILADLALVHRFMHLQLSASDEALSPVISWHNEPDRGYTVVNVCTWDRFRLFAKITGSLTAAGFNILGAEIMTRKDGIVLDTFFVTDAKTGTLANRDEKTKFEELLNRVLTGDEIDVSALIKKNRVRSSVYKSVEGEQMPTSIRFENETSQLQTVIDVEVEDHVGLLFAISQTLAECDVNISLAKILTEKGAAIDSFYVSDQWGNKITHLDHQKYVEKKLRVAIQNLEKS
jgi:[protein-PII] uridylyltransferase